MQSSVGSLNKSAGAADSTISSMRSMRDEFESFSVDMDRKTADSYKILTMNDRQFYKLKAKIAENSRLEIRKKELAEAKKQQADLISIEQKNRAALEAIKNKIKEAGTSASHKRELKTIQAEQTAYKQMLANKQAQFAAEESKLSGEELKAVKERNQAELAEMLRHGEELASKVSAAEAAVENSMRLEQQKKMLQMDQADTQRKVRSATAAVVAASEAAAEAERQVVERTFNAMRNAKKVMFQEASAAEKAEIYASDAELCRKQVDLAKDTYKKRVLEIYSEVNDEKKANELIEQARLERDRNIAEATKEAEENERQSLRMRAADQEQYFKGIKEAAEGAPGLDKFKAVGKAIIEFELNGADQLKAMAENQKKLAKEASEQAKKSRKDYEAIMNDPNATDEEKEEAEKKYLADAEFANQQNMANLAFSIGDAVSKSLTDAMGNVEKIIQENGAHIEARLQGSGLTYNGILGIGGILDSVSSMLSVNPLIKTENVLKAIRDASDAGVAYNLQNRAFLDTIADKIANTFDAFDSNLLRLIRLQQADTTAARLGMEAKLTNFFNSNFQDTSYLTTTRDTVASTLIDASASMSRNMSAEFEFTVHKWLGSLSSLGMSDEGVNEIAKGLNLLATGDVEQLSSSTELQTMLAMSASEAGLEYSELLLNGLDPASTNKLLSSMVSYLKRIAEESDNQVVRSAYGDVFNLSMSDMKAISNMTASDISKISSENMSYSQMNAETIKQIGLAATRTHLGEMLKTVYDNAVFSVSSDMVSNPVTYSMWKMLKYMEENTIDVEIPFVNVYGFGLDLNASVQDIMRVGLGAAGAASLVGNVLAGIASGGGMTSLIGDMLLGEYTRHGEGTVFATGEPTNNTTLLQTLNNINKSVSTSGDEGGYSASSSGESTSASSYVTTANNDDMENSTLNSATDDAQETSEITNKNSDIGYTIDDLYKVTVQGEEGTGSHRTEDILVKQVYRSPENWLTIRDSRMSFTGNSYADSLRVHDSYLFSIFSSRGVIYNDNAVRSVISQTAGESLSVHIASASNENSELKIKGEVSLTSKTVNDLSKAITGTYEVGGKSKKRTVNDLYTLFSSENDKFAHVRIQNENGSRLQVDTEIQSLGSSTGTTGWDSGWLKSEEGLEW